MQPSLKLVCKDFESNEDHMLSENAGQGGNSLQETLCAFRSASQIF